MKGKSRRNIKTNSRKSFGKIFLIKKGILALVAIAALTFTAAYSFNISAESLGQLLSGNYATGEKAVNSTKDRSKTFNSKDIKLSSRRASLGNFSSTAGAQSLFAPVLDPTPTPEPLPSEAEKVEPGARRRSEEVYGPFNYDIFLEREKNGEFPFQGSELPSSVPFDSLTNNNGGATGTSQFTQSETSVVAFGSTVVIGYNDSGSNAGGTNKFTGFSRSTDGGATFTDGGQLPTNAGGDAGDPVIARNNTTGRIYFSTLGFSVGTIQVFRSDDNGATWQAPVVGTPGGSSEDKQWIAVDNFAGAGNGNVYLMSRRFGSTGGGPGIYMFRSTDNGATFGPTNGTLIVAGNQGAYVTVAPDHSVYAFWYAGATLQVRKSTDFGVTFGAPVTVASGLVGGTNGDLGLTGRRQGTTTFSGFRSSEFPHAAVNPVNGNLYVVFANNPPGADKADVFFVQSTNGGATWSAPVRVNDDATTTDQWMPTLAVSTDGSRIGFFYYSRQEDPVDNNLFKYYGRIGTIAGATVTLAPSFAISDVPSLPEFGRDSLINSVYMGDYDTAYATPGFFHVVWSDNRDDLPGGAGRKDPNVYYDKIPLGLAVTTTIPAVNSIINTQPTNFTVNVTDPVNPASLDASDFTVNGIPASSVAYTPGTTTMMFTFGSSPVTTEGLQTMNVAAGAFTSASDGSPVVAFSGTFRYDTLQLQVVATAPPFPNGTFNLPAPFTYDVFFNEPVDPASVQTGDLTLSGVPGAIVTGVTVLGGNTTARFTISGVTTEGTMTASIGAGAVTDAFGNPGAPFSASYGVDIGTVPYPTPLIAKDPLGSLIYDPTASGTINFAGDTDSFTLNIDPGQTITLIVRPTSAGLQPSVTLRDPGSSVLGSATAAGAGQNALLQTVSTTTGGTYTMDVSGAGGTTGNYTLQVILNAAQEVEGTITGVSNNSIATAQDINASFTTLQTSLTSAERGAVTGNSDNANYSAAAVPFAFEDISGTGTVIAGLTNQDDTSVSIPIGFTFPLYGNNNTTIAVSSNGLLTFGGTDSTFTNSNLTTSPTLAAIAPFWDDQHTGGGVAGSNVYFQVIGAGSNQHLTIQWNKVRFFSGGTTGDTITYQAQLYSDGRIQFNYQDLVSGSAAGNNGASATVGIKAAGTQGLNRLLLAFNNGPNAFVGTGQSTLLSPPNPTPDFYSFNAMIGDVVTAGLETTGGTPTVTLLDSVGTILATGVGGSTNLDSVINNFTIPANGTYYLQTTNTASNPYNMVVTRNAAFDTEDNNTAATAQPIAGNRGALGAIAPTGNYFGTAVSSTFEDISGTGTVIAGLTNQDDASVSIPIGFSFPFYGTSNANVGVSSNGLLTFGGTDSSFTNADLTTSPALAAIAPFWDDQFVTGSPNSNVYFQVTGTGINQHLTIQWNQVSFFSGGTAGDTITYQAQLYVDGRIQFNYLDLTSGTAGGNNGASATVGVKAAGTQGPNRLLLAFNNGPNAFVGTGLSTLVTQPPGEDWYSVTLASGQNTIKLETSTPSDGPGEFVNTLNPRIQLFDSTGTTLLASGSALGDGRNESINKSGLSAGSYRVKVSSEGSTTGEYFMSVKKQTQTTTAVTVSPTSVQYSDKVTFTATISPASVLGEAPATDVTFKIGSGASAQSFGPVALAVDPMNSNQLKATFANAQILQAAGSYTVTAMFGGVDPDFIVTNPTTSLTVTKEDTNIALDMAYPTTIQVSTPGGTAAPFTRCVNITEAADGSLGNIALAQPVAFTVSAVAPGPTPTVSPVTYTVSGGTLKACATFTGAEPNVYDIHVEIGGNYYQGSYDFAVVIFDPSLGFMTGGGTIINPNTGYPVNFGIHGKYLRNNQAKGALLFIEHRPTGDVIVKSNSIQSLSIVGTTTAVLVGKSTFNGVGNHGFRATVVDNGEPGSSDKFGLQLFTPSNSPIADYTFSPVTLTGGNIQVPH